jgi:iron(III) transport system substrate-binding protein
LLQTLLLKREGLLQPYKSPVAKDIPAAFKDAEGAWTGLGVRPRVVVFHDNFWSAAPTLKSLSALGNVGISNPQFGTASDWVAALATRWGGPKTLDFFRAFKKNGGQVLPGNSVVAEKVRKGELSIGVTDSDDYLAQQKKNGSILSVLQQEDIVLVPGSVAMLHSAPHPEAARKLMDALLSRDTEQKLMQQMHGVYGLRGQTTPKELLTLSDGGSLLRNAPNDTAQWPAAWDKIREPLAQILLSD